MRYRVISEFNRVFYVHEVKWYVYGSTNKDRENVSIKLAEMSSVSITILSITISYHPVLSIALNLRNPSMPHHAKGDQVVTILTRLRMRRPAIWLSGCTEKIDGWNSPSTH